MNQSNASHVELPQWVHSIGVATWASDPEGNLIFANERFGKLFDKNPKDCIGAPCHQVVAGLSEDGEPFCSRFCNTQAKLNRGEEVEPYTVRVGEPDNGDGHWLQMLVIPFEQTEKGTFTIHCAFLTDRAHIIEGFLDRVASRTPVNMDRSFDLEKAKLSKRETEVLDHLAADDNLYEIAEKLNISYYTVRNHVQHILGKMGVHSTLEAVALYLLSKAPEED